MQKDPIRKNTNHFENLDKGLVARFITHIHKFMVECELYPKNGKAVVGVSGGLDSMCLVAVLELLKKRGYLEEVEYLHINHNSRAGHDSEEKILNEIFQDYGLKLVTRKVNWKKVPGANFEHDARVHRYELFRDELESNDLMYLAHHLDDSFEWSLLQSMRSSNAKTTLGIPVKRGPFRRPFMCVSRDQLERFAGELELDYMDDPTNQNTRFERNYIRHQIIPQIKKRYPKYLKHYAHRSNDVARHFGVHAVTELKETQVFRYKEASILVDKSLQNKFDGAEEELLTEIHRISQTNRGTYKEQIKKILIGVRNFKQGPLKLSGGVSCFLSPNMILLTTDVDAINQIDSKSKRKAIKELKYKKLHKEELLTRVLLALEKADGWTQFPFFVLVKSKNADLHKKKKHIALENTSNKLESMDRDFWPALDLLRYWLKNPRLKSNKLKLALLQDL
jgi:tRNA(Ile)-lysidine synthase